jgi:siroheme synthase-like protein
MTRLAHPSLFPMFLNLEGRLCVVVGAGRIAESKIAALRASGARVRVVAPRATRRVKAWSANREITWIPRRFAARDLNGSALVIAATNCPHTNQAIFDADASRRVPCNAVDDPARCDFYFPAIVRRGPLQIAISTSGCSPALTTFPRSTQAGSGS